ESDVNLKIVSPIDASYNDYSEAACGNYSSDCILLKLNDQPRLFDELRSYIKTEKYIRKTSATGNEQEQLRREKANENSNRRKRLVTELEDLIKASDFYTLGSPFDAKGGSILVMLEGAYRYIIENTFGKLKLIKPFQGNIIQETQQTLVAGDTAQIGLDLKSEKVNLNAINEVIQHITLSDNNGYPVNAADIIKKFSKRPFGWNTDEIVLILARLGLANKIIFQANQQDVPLKQLYDHLSKSQKRANLRIRKIKQQSEANLTKATKLYKDLGFGSAPNNEKELFNLAVDNNDSKLKVWLNKLKKFKSMSITGTYPGKNEIENGIQLIAGLTELKNSFQFVEQFIALSGQLEDFAEDYEELENFYETQFTMWQDLNNALTITFAKNRIFLEKKEESKKALDKLHAIYTNSNPYREICNIKPLIEQVTKIDTELVKGQRDHTIKKLQGLIEDITKLVQDAGATPEISNQALLPLQNAIKRVINEATVSQITQELKESAEWFDDAETLINDYIRLQQALAREAEIEAKKLAEQKEEEIKAGSASGKVPEQPAPTITESVVVVKPIAKPTESVDAMAVYNEVSGTTYMESLADVEKYITALRIKLTYLVQQNNKVRIK
ncbi:MAG: BREX system P-loop protein BrxC, partial [Psychromonas sp.]|nr:BREX system P-loop protein BrxC [Psychromonas sp.]